MKWSFGENLWGHERFRRWELFGQRMVDRVHGVHIDAGDGEEFFLGTSGEVIGRCQSGGSECFENGIGQSEILQRSRPFYRFRFERSDREALIELQDFV